MSSPISGFTAIPNPQMLAFMPIQSYLMMYFAGSGWQYGKRKISAMSNEQFNKLTPEELLKQHSIELKNMLPTLDKTLNDVSPLIRTLIEQYGDFVREAIKAVPQAVSNIFQAGPTAVAGGGAHSGLLTYAQIQLQQQVALEELKHAGSHQDIKSEADALTADTSGMTLAEHEANKAAERARLVAAKANRPKQIQAFGSTKITAQVRADVTKRKAGQSVLQQRALAIREIARYGGQVQQLLKDPVKNRGAIAGRKKLLQSWQQNLTNLLARYRF